jgi:hypothetical protein
MLLLLLLLLLGEFGSGRGCLSLELKVGPLFRAAEICMHVLVFYIRCTWYATDHGSTLHIIKVLDVLLFVVVVGSSVQAGGCLSLGLKIPLSRARKDLYCVI